MKVVAINGSPRKDWNTATVLKKALEGAAARGAEAELIHLADYANPGCISCFACKQNQRTSHGKCLLKDELAPVLEKVTAADAFVLGAPIYLGAVNGMMQSFFERLIFPYICYGDYAAHHIRQRRTGYIYTLGADEERIREAGFDRPAHWNQMLLERFFGPSEYLLVSDTYQFDDYAQYETSRIDVAGKAKRRQEVFPVDCEKAFALGARLCDKLP